jgi:PAS domain S-box-containing protein
MIGKTQKVDGKSAESLASEGLYRRLFETSRDGILILDGATGKIIDVNPCMVDLLCYSRDEFLGKELWEIGLLKNSTVSQEAFRELQKNGYLRYDDLLLQTKKGDRREVELVSSAYHESGRQIIQCNIRDMTERLQAEEQLRKAHSRLSFHVENTPLAVIEWDSDFRVSRWSNSAESIFGWKAEEVLGKRIEDWRFVFAEDFEAVEQVTLRQRAGIEQQGVSRNRNYAKDGSILYCDWYNSVLRDRSGKLESVLSLVLDVTARKQAEEERAQFLAREQAARREAEEANRIKDEFLATLSHELRTPLTAIIGWSHMLSAGSLDPAKYRHAFETILRNAKSQGQLIDDLLDVSRIITGKLQLEPTPIDLCAVINAAVGSLRLAAQAKGIRLQLALDSDAGQVSGDPERLQQVIWNLLSNAIKFTSVGGRVHVCLERVGSFVTIRVSDTGQGIAPEFLPYVFDRFRQADGGSARKHRGLGLGLAIVRHLVELHGGTAQAESKGQGQGAIFTVKLPIFVAADRLVTSSDLGQQGQPQFERGAGSDHPVRLDGLRVLIVDDEVDAQDIITTILQQNGAETVAVGSAKEALETWRSWRPDVLVSDIGMPVEDGYALIRRVRSRPASEGGQIPAIALTAYVRPEDRSRILLAGYQVHVGKPIEPVDLIAAVAGLAKARRAGT